MLLMNNDVREGNQRNTLGVSHAHILDMCISRIRFVILFVAGLTKNYYWYYIICIIIIMIFTTFE